MRRNIRPSAGSFGRLRTAVAAAGILGCLGLVAASTALAASGSVKMIERDERYAFSPQTISTHVGDSITWTNTSDASHTVTSDTAGIIDSPKIAEGKSFSMTFDSAGTIAYHCTIHSYMHGTIHVLAAGATLPETDAAPITSTGGDASVAVEVALAGLFGLGVVRLVALRTERER